MLVFYCLLLYNNQHQHQTSNTLCINKVIKTQTVEDCRKLWKQYTAIGVYS